MTLAEARILGSGNKEEKYVNGEDTDTQSTSTSGTESFSPKAICTMHF